MAIIATAKVRFMTDDRDDRRVADTGDDDFILKFSCLFYYEL